MLFERLLAAGTYFLYKTYLLQKVETYVMFFKGSLQGLDARSSVTYRGVKIGEVSRIELTEDRAKKEVKIPVYVRFFVERTIGFKHNPISLLIQNGYIADISKPSLLSGVSNIELIEPETKQPFRKKYYNKHPVFPTTTVVEKYTTIDETLKVAQSSLKDFSQFIQSQEVKEMIRSMDSMADSFNRLANRIDQNVTPFVAYFTQGMEDVSKAANSTQNFMDYLSQYPESLLRGRA